MTRRRLRSARIDQTLAVAPPAGAGTSGRLAARVARVADLDSVDVVQRRSADRLDALASRAAPLTGRGASGLDSADGLRRASVERPDGLAGRTEPVSGSNLPYPDSAPTRRSRQGHRVEKTDSVLTSEPRPAPRNDAAAQMLTRRRDRLSATQLDEPRPQARQEQPIPRPPIEQPTPRPLAEQPIPRPPTEQPISQRLAEQPTPRLLAEQPIPSHGPAAIPTASPGLDWSAISLNGPWQAERPEPGATQVIAPAGLATDPADVSPLDTASSLPAVRFNQVQAADVAATAQPLEPTWQPSESALAAPKRQSWPHRFFAHLGFHRPGARPVMTIVALVVLLALVGGATFLVVRLSRSDPPPPIVATQEATPSPGSAGATAWSKDHVFTDGGNFRFRIVSITDGLLSLTNNDLNLSERGQFYVVELEVIWEGEQDGTFFAYEQVLGTSQGQTYHNEPESASIYCGVALGAEVLQRGQPQRGCLVFDIPKDQYPDRLELMGALGRDLVTVPLG
ncbi:MAG: hypothetical protein FWG16_05125 [Micrococcales bacterium]|nr:hypothetical protein [Micrococcales bacterium]